MIGAGSLGLAAVAGALSTLSPCVLPLLPVLIGGAAQGHRLGPLALAAGLSLSFASLGLFLALFGFALGLDGSLFRNGAAALMAVFGLVLLVPALQRGFAQALSPLTGGGNALLARFTPDGLGGQFLLGLLLGAVWSPCTGPTLGAAVGLAAQAGSAGGAGLIMLVFGLGAGLPLVLLAYAFRGGVRRMAGLSRLAKPILGGALLFVGILVLSGLDKALETRLVALLPDWLIDLVTRF
ncbi:putative cytochrome c-type biogenesis protein membrane protein [Rhodospirillaceae bacterium LM-1]|nr:putative cytochrome c-type biogenesis protein membrane protein [Rhodospirillaceae bacterium LM-1]